MTGTSGPNAGGRTTSPRGRWDLRSIVLLVVLAVVFGFLYWALDQAWGVLQVAMGPLGDLAQNVLIGAWIVVAPLAIYIVRRPLVGVLVETAAAFVEVAFLGAPFGPILLVTGLVQGGGAELPFALTRYRSYSWPVFLLSGLTAAAASFVYEAFRFGWWGQDLLLLRLVVHLASGVLFTGLLARLVGDGLTRAGALDNYPIGRAHAVRRRASGG